jgi:hypothetical protein
LVTGKYVYSSIVQNNVGRKIFGDVFKSTVQLIEIGGVFQMAIECYVKRTLALLEWKILLTVQGTSIYARLTIAYVNGSITLMYV